MNDYANHTEPELVSLLKNGDQGAYREIYIRYFRILLAFTQRKLQDKEQAKDLLQDLFVQIWDKRECMDPEGSLSGYFFRAIRNRIVNVIVRRDTEKRYMDSLYDFIDRDSRGTDDLIREKQLSASIEREINLLPRKMREVFLLSRHANLTYNEIAELLKLAPTSAKTHGRNALGILRRKLKF